MEHNTNILSSQIQNAPATKNDSRFGLSNTPTEEGFAKFGTVLRDALEAGQTELAHEGVRGQDVALIGLEQRIVALSAETEDLLTNANPEAVEGILSEAATQLWELIGNFDVQNGTQYVSEISGALVDGQDVTYGAELFSGALMQPTSPLVAQMMASDIPVPTGRVEVQSLIFSQAQANDLPLFANVTNLLLKPQSLAQNGQQSGTASQAIANAPALEGIDMIPRAAFDLPQQIQQFTVESPLKRQALENTVSGQVTAELASTGNKVNADIIQLAGGVDVKAKVKELLIRSAQTIVSNTNAPDTSLENPGQLLLTRAELQSVNTTVQQEQARPARSFSQNVANQIQGRTLNEGITRIELAPRGLGNILIELQTKETGDIQVIVKAENPTVLHALRTDREAFLSVLSNEASSREEIDLEFEEFTEGQFNHEEDGVIPSEEKTQSELENEDADNPSSTIQRPLGIGQLDILT